MMKISPESVESERAWWNEALHALRVYIQADITEAENQAKKLQQDLAKALEKSAGVRASYEADKARYRELTGSNKAK